MYQHVNTLQLLGNLAVIEYRLENGLRVAVVPDRTVPIFTYQTWFNVGSADEPAGRQGLAHLFEHMMFRRTVNRALGEWERLVNANGGTGINAYTSRDQTVYFFTFPNDKFDLVADLESDRMKNLVIDDETFETEKGAVLTEKNRGLDDPLRFIWEETYKTAYTVHPYRYPTIGEFDSIKGFTVEEARTFYADYYAPNNALIVVVGDIDTDNVMGTIEKYYGKFEPRSARKRTMAIEPGQTEDRQKHLSHPKATQPMLAKVWHIPNMRHPDYPGLAMTGKLLTSGKTAILQERLVNRGKVTNFYADAFMSKDLGSFEFFAQLARGESFESIEEVFFESVRELSGGKINDDQITIVKNHLMKEIYQSATMPSALARLLGDGFINTDELAFQIKAIEAIRRATPNDVQSVIARYLLNAKVTTVHLQPS